MSNAELDYPYCCPRYDCSSADADKDAENEVFTGIEGAKDFGEIDELYMSASEDRSPITVEYDVVMGDSDDKVGRRSAERKTLLV